VVEAQAVEDRAQDTRLAPASAPPRAEAAAEAQTADQDQPDLVSDDAGPERDAPAVTTPRLTAASGARAEAAR
jgi:hypothetical protein